MLFNKVRTWGQELLVKMDYAFIMMLIGGTIFALAIGLSLGKLTEWLKDRNLKKTGKKFLYGEAYNIMDFEGEKVHVNKFVWKDHEGKIHNTEIPLRTISPPIAPTNPQER